MLPVIAADEVLVPAVSQGVVFFNEVVNQEVKQAVINGVHTIFGTDLNLAGEHGESTIANASTDTVVHRHDLRGEHPPEAVLSRQQMLAHNATQTAR